MLTVLIASPCCTLLLAPRSEPNTLCIPFTVLQPCFSPCPHPVPTSQLHLQLLSMAQSVTFFL